MSDNNQPLKPIVNFAHANGFPAGSYRKMFAELEDDYQVIALEKYAHNPKFPLRNHWNEQADELVDFVQQHTSTPCYAVGHSFGAVISYIAVCRYPELFKGLVMLDPPLITGLARHLFRFSKRNRLINKITPAGITEIRKQQWLATDDVESYFINKKLFKNFDPCCLSDYVTHATAHQGEHRRLTFDVSTEANIFRTIPDNLHQYFGKLKVPATLITGRYTDVCIKPLRTPFLKGNPSVEHVQFHAGAHMFPLEYPSQVGELVNSIVSTWETTRR